MRHDWKIGPRGKDTCKRCKALRRELVDAYVPSGHGIVFLFSFPKTYAREKSIWSTFVPGCIARNLAGAP